MHHVVGIRTCDMCGRQFESTPRWLARAIDRETWYRRLGPFGKVIERVLWWWQVERRLFRRVRTLAWTGQFGRDVQRVGGQVWVDV